MTTTALMVVAGSDDIVGFDDVREAICAATEHVRSGAPGAAVHIAKPLRHESGYTRQDAANVSAIVELAGPQQVLVSQTAAERVTDLPLGMSLRDEGLHELPALEERLRIFLVVAAGLSDAGIRGPTSADVTFGRLPALLTPTVGREGELAELTAMLADPTCRLITLTGPGGTGKTRLAIEFASRVADRYPDGVAFSPLATITRADDMWMAMAHALGIPADGQSPPSFFTYVADKRALLVLDNLEQISDVGRLVSELLVNARKLTVLATSRKVLRVSGERQHEVPPLELPQSDSMDDVARAGAIELFVATAQRVNQHFQLDEANASDLAALCRALDGLPLALELAAARTRMLTPKSLLQRLDTALDLADKSADAVDRQRTLRATIEWSYRLLSPEEQLVLRKLAVFAGGANQSALQSVAGQLPQHAELWDVLDELIDASLVKADLSSVGETRFGLLETIRRFAVDITTPDELDATRTAHAQHFFDVLSGHVEQDTSSGWVSARLLADRANLSEVLQRGARGVTSPLVDGEVHPLHVLSLFVSLGIWMRWHSDAQAWLDLSQRGAYEQEPLGAWACGCLRIPVLEIAGRHEEAVESALELAENSIQVTSLGTSPLSWLDPVERLSHSLYYGARAACRLARADDARALLERFAGVSPTNQDTLQFSNLSGAIAELAGDYEGALRWDRLSLDHARRAGDIGNAMVGAMNIASSLLDHGERRSALEQLLARTPEEFASLSDEGLETYGELLAASVAGDQPLMAARIMGALTTYRSSHHRPPHTPYEEETLERQLADPRRSVTHTAWLDAVERGRDEDLSALFREVEAGALAAQEPRNAAEPT
jgi:predicted ATPase